MKRGAKPKNRKKDKNKKRGFFASKRRQINGKGGLQKAVPNKRGFQKNLQVRVASGC